jgi:site-specific DNA recombinase
MIYDAPVADAPKGVPVPSAERSDERSADPPADQPIIPFARGSQRLRRQAARRGREEGGARLEVAFYGRLSRNRDGTITGIERQEHETVPWAALKGWDVTVRFVDDDTSAFALGRKRPGFEALMAALESEQVRGVVVWSLDRLVRRTLDWVRVLPRAEETPWFAASFTQGINTAEPMGRLLAGILVSMAEAEATNIRTRTQSKHSELARAGKWSGGGTRAYGHSANRQAVVEAEAEVIREVAGRIVNGEPLVAIAGDLERRGVRGPSGQPIASTVWRRMLLSPRLIGRRIDDDGRLSATTGMAPVVDEELMRQVWAVLDRPSGSAGIGTARRHLLTGFLVCGQCGERLKPWVNKQHPTFACLKVPARAGCGKTSIAEEPVEAVVVEAALRYLERLDLARFAAKADSGAERLVAAVAQEDAKLADLARSRFDAQTISEAEFQAARLPILRRREELLGRLNARALRPPKIGTGSIRAAWAHWNLHERRRALEAVIAKVVVAPGYAPRQPRPDGSFARGRPTRRLRPSERLKIEPRRV